MNAGAKIGANVPLVSSGARVFQPTTPIRSPALTPASRSACSTVGAAASIDAHQAERRAEDDVDLDRDDRDVADVLLAEKQRAPAPPEHEQNLLEARVEVAEEDEARRVLAVAVHDDLIDIDRREERCDPLFELGRGYRRQRLGDVERRHADVGQLDRSRHGASFNRGDLDTRRPAAYGRRQVTR